MDQGADRLAEAERSLRQALQVLAGGDSYEGEEWMLLATLVGEADLIVREEQQNDPAIRVPLLEIAVAELREVTAGFTDPTFLRSTGAARRRNPQLFSGRV